jgi:hypothetical protein
MIVLGSPLRSEACPATVSWLVYNIRHEFPPVEWALGSVRHCWLPPRNKGHCCIIGVSCLSSCGSLALQPGRVNFLPRQLIPDLLTLRAGLWEELSGQIQLLSPCPKCPVSLAIGLYHQPLPGSQGYISDIHIVVGVPGTPTTVQKEESPDCYWSFSWFLSGTL